MVFRVDLSQNQTVDLGPDFTQTLHIKREDLIHPQISGNKYRKLKYNLERANAEGKDTLLTFGGAFSNHILAVAVAGKTFGFKTVGVIRGEELEGEILNNPTLKQAQDYGMRFIFVSRENYRHKNSEAFLETIKTEVENCYIIPEGGTNTFAIKGCQEILTPADLNYDFICCAVGTGGTIAGIINSSVQQQQILGFPALKGDFLKEEITKFAQNSNWRLMTDYHFGGYGKINTDLISFINQFKTDYKIPLDPVYTGKMLYGVMDLLKNGYFPEHSKILVIHTGGLQGIAGMNMLLKKKHLPLINYI